MNWRSLPARAEDKLAQVVTDVLITDTDFHALDPARRETDWDDFGRTPVDIGNDILIGAGSAVTRSVPAHAVVAGNPAAIVRLREADAP